MKDVNITCPVCEEDVTITAREIRLAMQHRNETGGKALVSCSNCCRVMVLPDNIPEGDVELEEWIVKQAESNDWLACLRLLEPELEKEPLGCNDYNGKKLYIAGLGGQGLTKRAYMFAFGIDPERMLAKKGLSGKPFKIGGVK